MISPAGESVLIAGAFGPAPELLARELRALGHRPAFVERASGPEDAEALIFFCGPDAGERLAPRLEAASTAALAARVKRVRLVRLEPPTGLGLAAEHALRLLAARGGASLEVVGVGPADPADALARRLAAS